MVLEHSDLGKSTFPIRNAYVLKSLISENQYFKIGVKYLRRLVASETPTIHFRKLHRVLALMEGIWVFKTCF